MIIGTIIEFLGHFHPLLVHLPIGILLLGIGFDVLSTRPNFAHLKPVISLTYGLGALSAWGSCASGYLLSLDGDYAVNALQQHLWSGIITAILGTLAWWMSFNAATAAKTLRFRPFLAGILLLSISVSGHLGGSLTHGENYLFETATAKKVKARAPIANVQEAAVYAEVVAPIFAEKCETCHGAGKQKGKLRMDGIDYLKKGGKSKKPLLPDPSHSGNGLVLTRMLLPIEEDLHMPPKQKPQLNTDENTLIAWWIKAGASFDKKVKDLPQSDAVKKALARLQNDAKNADDTPPTDPYSGIQAKAADPGAIKALNEHHVLVLPIGQNSNLLSANFVNAGKITPELLQLLEPIREQLVWVRLSDAKLNDEALKTIGQLPNLTKLYLDHTAISDNGLKQLSGLKHLQFLNLAGCKISANGLLQLKALPKLQQLFLFECPIEPAEWAGLKQAFPHAVLDSGGYHLEKLMTDTAMLKGPSM